ncbi:hypothetical protein BB558_001016 [Smittium angustum]|uniref:Uncharacterized protein n=1 Tax=Smittium angustum TaxID=133377 RepID=A0A2U1JCY8_SMIAN|nr:hypothetical protein BB558_001016 [Smittium angustum]
METDSFLPQLNTDLMLEHLNSMKTQAKDLSIIVDKLASRASDEDNQINEGFDVLLEYVADLGFVALLKLNKKSIENHSVLERLVENRIVLEKIRPIEQKMRYQIDKLVRTALTTQPEPLSSRKNNLVGTNSNEFENVGLDPETLIENTQNIDEDEYMYKPKISSLIDSAKSQGILTENVVKSNSSKNVAYQPPKLVPVHFEEDSSLKTRREKAEQRMKERAAKSRIIQDLVSEFDNRPETSSSWGTSDSIGVASSTKAENIRRERTKYEEDHFIRMVVSKKDKKSLRQGIQRLDDEFAGLNDFAAIDSLEKANTSSKTRSKNVIDKASRKYNSGNNSESQNSVKPFEIPKNTNRGKFQNKKRKISKK